MRSAALTPNIAVPGRNTRSKTSHSPDAATAYFVPRLRPIGRSPARYGIDRQPPSATPCRRTANEGAVSDRAEVYRRRFVGIRPRTSVLRGAEK
jgi:hypothetical protein